MGGGARLTCPRPSNQQILLWTLLSFSTFVVFEFVGALSCNSLSLFGDASAMSVDVLTYACNLYAEHAKRSGRTISESSRFVLVVGIPLLSSSALILVTIFIMVQAVRVLHAPPAVDDVALSYLYFFAMINFIVDVFCFFLVYSRGDDIFEENSPLTASFDPFLDSIVGSQDEEDAMIFEHEERDLVDEIGEQSFVMDFTLGACARVCGVRGGGPSVQPSSSSSSSSSYLPSIASNGNAKFLCCCCEIGSTAVKRNLNMLSAFTHIGGDSLRTLSVFCAATYSSLSGVDGDVCDAYAAIAVGITIVLLVLPLFGNIIIACSTFKMFGGSGMGHSHPYAQVRQVEMSSLVPKKHGSGVGVTTVVRRSVNGNGTLHAEDMEEYGLNHDGS